MFKVGINQNVLKEGRFVKIGNLSPTSLVDVE
jgi:hypothetical protein